MGNTPNKETEYCFLSTDKKLARIIYFFILLFAGFASKQELSLAVYDRRTVQNRQIMG
jgi:hypothetical protein